MEPQRALRIDPEKPTVAVLFEQFAATLRLKGDTEKYIDDVLTGLRDAIDTQHWTWPDQITAESAIVWLERRKARGNGPKYRNELRGYVGHFCAFLIKRGLLDRNPVAAVPRARRAKRPARYVPEVSEVVRLIVAADSDWRKGDRWLVYVVAASSGLRKGSLQAVEWAHCHEAEFPPRFDLPGEAMKSGEPATVWMTEEVARFLAEYRKRSGGKGRVFRGVPLKSEHFDRDLAKAGIPKARQPGGPTFTLHSLRHFASNRMKWAGRFTDDERAAQNAHQSRAMTENVYTDPSHVELGKKIFALKPLLPPHFRPRWGRRETKSGRSLIDAGEDADYSGLATSGDQCDPPIPDHIRIPPVEGRPGVATRVEDHSLALDGAGSGVVAAAHREEPSRPPVIGGSGSNPVTPIQRPNTPDLIGALTEVIQAQARLIAMLTGASDASQDANRQDRT